MDERENPTHFNSGKSFTNLPLTFLFIYNLTKHQKINNMRFKNLTWFYNLPRINICLSIFYFLQFIYCRNRN
jgi:hypothetical protein